MWPFDVTMLAVLGGVAWAARWGSLPSDGLWFDDSWVAAGAFLGSPGDLLTVGSSQPGFSAILILVDRLGGGDLTYLGVPSLLFGAVTPPALYLGLRCFGYERAISTLLSAALVVAPVPILYAGRVKGYTLDTLVVLLIAIAIPLLARRTWHWPLAAAWSVAAIGTLAQDGRELPDRLLAGGRGEPHHVGRRHDRVAHHGKLVRSRAGGHGRPRRRAPRCWNTSTSPRPPGIRAAVAGAGRPVGRHGAGPPDLRVRSAHRSSPPLHDHRAQQPSHIRRVRRAGVRRRRLRVLQPLPPDGDRPRRSPRCRRGRGAGGVVPGPDGDGRVRPVVGDCPHALVILGSRTRRDRTQREFEVFAPRVPVGSYL